MNILHENVQLFTMQMIALESENKRQKKRNEKRKKTKTNAIFKNEQKINPRRLCTLYS